MPSWHLQRLHIYTPVNADGCFEHTLVNAAMYCTKNEDKKIKTPVTLSSGTCGYRTDVKTLCFDCCHNTLSHSLLLGRFQTDLLFTRGFVFTSSERVQHVLKALDFDTGTGRRCLMLDTTFFFILTQLIHGNKVLWQLYQQCHL